VIHSYQNDRIRLNEPQTQSLEDRLNGPVFLRNLKIVIKRTNGTAVVIGKARLEARKGFPDPPHGIRCRKI
jgi:hypothetical protein